MYGSNLVDLKSYINFIDDAIISMENTSPNSLYLSIGNQFQNVDSVWGQNRAACGSPEKWTITRVIEVQFG